MWHVATADAASVAPAHALHSSQDIRYISRLHTGNPIGTWLCSISKLTILNFQLFFSYVFYSIFYFDFFEFFELFEFVCSLQKKIVCLLNISFDFLMFFSHFYFVFLFYFVWETSKKIQRTLSVLFVILSFFCFEMWKCFAGTEHDDARRLADGVSTSRFSILGRVRAESPRTRNARHELTKRNASSR